MPNDCHTSLVLIAQAVFPMHRPLPTWITIIISVSLSISIASGVLMVQACCLDRLSVCLCMCLESVLRQNG